MEFINNIKNNNYNFNNYSIISILESNINQYNINSLVSIKENIIKFNKLFEDGFSEHLIRDKRTIQQVIKSITNNKELMDQCHHIIKGTQVIVGSIQDNGVQELFELVGSISNDLLVSSYAFEVLYKELNGSIDLLRKICYILSVASIYSQDKNSSNLNKIKKLLGGSVTSISNAINTNNIILNNIYGSSNEIKSLLYILYKQEEEDFYHFNDELESIIADENYDQIQYEDSVEDLETQWTIDNAIEPELDDVGNFDASDIEPEEHGESINEDENEDQIPQEDSESDQKIQDSNDYIDEPEFEENDGDMDSGDIESDDEQVPDYVFPTISRSRKRLMDGTKILIKGLTIVTKILSKRFTIK